MKIKVPDGMLKAAAKATGGVDQKGYFIRLPLEAALRWLAENPIIPTLDQCRLLFEKNQYGVSVEAWQKYFTEWQRRMFLDSEPEVDELANAKKYYVEKCGRPVCPECLYYPGHASWCNIARKEGK